VDFEHALSQSCKDSASSFQHEKCGQYTKVRAGTHRSRAPQPAPSHGRSKKEENPGRNWKC